MTRHIRITREELIALGPCQPSARLALFGRFKYLTASRALDAGASVSDVLWVAGKLGRKDLCARFALACAQSVAHLSTDLRVQTALDATQAWLDDPSPATVRRAAAAAAAAWAAAGDAADAAVWADAAASAAWAAAGDAADAAQKEIMKQIFG